MPEPCRGACRGVWRGACRGAQGPFSRHRHVPAVPVVRTTSRLLAVSEVEVDPHPPHAIPHAMAAERVFCGAINWRALHPAAPHSRPRRRSSAIPAPKYGPVLPNRRSHVGAAPTPLTLALAALVAPAGRATSSVWRRSGGVAPRQIYGADPEAA